MMSAYLTSTNEALALLKKAIHEAKALLPQYVLKQHSMAGKHSPAAWKAVEAWYRNQPNPDPQIERILTDLSLLSEARACLTTLVMEQPVVADGLKLARTRRSA